MMTTKKTTTSRSQRANKGIKWKHILQICVLVGVCVWLIYQLKYSHEKKKEFYEKDTKTMTVSRDGDGVAKLGRKDLPHSRVVSKNERVVEDEDEDSADEEETGRGEEEKENEHRDEEEREEEEEEEGKNKRVEEENKLVEEQDMEDDDGSSEDDIDEQDQGKTGKTDRENEEEKEREGNNGEKGSESNGRNEEEEWKIEDGNDSDEIDMTVHEAREEHYKADDASSAVSHNEKGNSDTNVSRVAIEQIGLGESGDETSANKTNTEEKDGGDESLSSYSRIETQSDDHPESKSRETDNSNSSEISLEASGLAESKAESAITPEGASDLPVDSERSESKESSTEAPPSNRTSESVVTENVSENSDLESSDLSSTDETADSSDNMADGSDNTISEEEKEALTDLQTLPDIRTEGMEDEEVVASE
ncbi:PREDICTED: myb-like protein X isoform X2 [Tarenaya hassleriana]|nr:PREDICTED: myb-like protein X isoform X2 [Tarenaya hassleriana]